MRPRQLSHIAKRRCTQSQAANPRLTLWPRDRANLDQPMQAALQFPFDWSDVEPASRYAPNRLSSRSSPIKNILGLPTTFFRNGWLARNCLRNAFSNDALSLTS